MTRKARGMTMNRYGVPLIWIGMMVCLVFQTGNGLGAEMQKRSGPPVPPVKPITRPAPVRPPDRPASRVQPTFTSQSRRESLPDLVVERIWLEQGRVAFQLANRGRGPIPGKEFARSQVTVACGTQRKILGLRTAADPGMVIVQPGSSVTVRTGFEPASRKKIRACTVTVAADSNRVIREQNEGNNSRTLAPRPTSLVSATSTQAKTRTAKRTVRSVAKNLPKTLSLVITRIFPEHGTLRVQFRNDSRQQLDQRSLSATRLVVRMKEQHRSWPLTRFKGWQRLALPGATLVVDTGLRPEKSVQVVVRLEQGTRIARKTALIHLPGVKTGAVGGLAGTGRKSPVPDARQQHTATVPAVRIAKMTAPPDSVAGGGTVPGRLYEPAGPQTDSDAAYRPNLKIMTFSVQPATPRALTDAVTFRVGVRNFGDSSTETPCTLRLGVMNSYPPGDEQPLLSSVLTTPTPASVDENNIPVLGPGEEQTVTVPMRLHAGGQFRPFFFHNGWYMVSARAICPSEGDDPHSNGFWDRGSRAHLLVQVDPAPGQDNPADLVLDDLARTTNNRLKLIMRNNSTRTDLDLSQATVRLVIRKGDQVVSRTVPMDRIDTRGYLLASGGGGRLAWLWPDHQTEPEWGIDPDLINGAEVTVALNWNRAIFEENYDNNVAFRVFEARYPDLVICHDKYVFIQPRERNLFSVKVKNIGTARYTGHGEMILEMEGKGYVQRGIPALGPGEEREVFWSEYYWLTSGKSHFTLTVDSLNRVDEGADGEQNNILRGIVDRSYDDSQYWPAHVRDRPICSNDPTAAVPVP